MTPANKLDALIKANKGYITNKQALVYGIHREYLSLYVNQGKLVRVRNGVYRKDSDWDDFMYAFQIKRTKLIYSHDTALYLNGLTDRDPLVYYVTFPTGYNANQIKQDNVKPFAISSNLFNVGKTKRKTMYGNEVDTYDAERTICDMLRSRNKVDKYMVLEGLKKYTKKKDKNIDKLRKYARLFRVDKILNTYLEVLL